MRLTPGALWLQLRLRFDHGLRVAWYRDVVRPRILSTAPIEQTTDQRCEIHVLTSKADWLNLIWTLKSFYVASGRRYALCIHEDGSLADTELATLSDHFPAARIIRRSDADAKLTCVLRDFPRSLQFRMTNLLAPKLFDFVAFLESDRLALFDSDLLFFAEPTVYLQRLEDPQYRCNTFNADNELCYTVDLEQAGEQIGHQVLPLVNSGLGLVHRDSIRWQWIEEFLGLPGLLKGHSWRIEQTLFALCSSRFGAELLPDEYSVRLGRGIGRRPFRHYVGSIRHLMYSEGIATLLQQGFLAGEWLVEVGETTHGYHEQQSASHSARLIG
jgi:hypothetical protein